MAGRAGRPAGNAYLCRAVRAAPGRPAARKMPRIALFPGTFDPFTTGHADIVERGLALFDEIVVAVGCNAAKRPMLTAEERVARISRLYAGEPRVRCAAYEGLTADFARRTGARFLLRGVRSVRDFEYERDLADINRRIAGIETVLLCCDPALAALSSAAVRELAACGCDVSEFLPPEKTNPKE